MDRFLNFFHLPSRRDDPLLQGDGDVPSSEPCGFARRALEATAANQASWISRWYALAHSARCPRCRRFLEELSVLIRDLGASRAEAVDAAAVQRLTEVLRRNAG